MVNIHFEKSCFFNQGCRNIELEMGQILKFVPSLIFSALFGFTKSFCGVSMEVGHPGHENRAPLDEHLSAEEVESIKSKQRCVACKN